MHDHPAIATFVEAIETIKPTCIIGVSTVHKLFNQQVIEARSADLEAHVRKWAYRPEYPPSE